MSDKPIKKSIHSKHGEEHQYHPVMPEGWPPTPTSVDENKTGFIKTDCSGSTGAGHLTAWHEHMTTFSGVGYSSEAINQHINIDKEKQKEIVETMGRVISNLSLFKGSFSKFRAKNDIGFIHVPILTFAPEPYHLMKNIIAVVQQVDDEYTATFYDANISAGGDNQTEAVLNLKELIINFYENLIEEKYDNLGPEMKRQLAVLKEFIQKEEE